MNPREYAEELFKDQAGALVNLHNAREDEVNGYLDLQRVQDNLSRVTRDLIIEVISQPDFDNVNPITGMEDPQWGQWVVDRKLEKNPKFIEALSAVDGAQRFYLQAKAKAENLKDQLASLNIKLEVIARMLE